MSDPNQIVFDAVAFAAWAHRHQVRKDNKTPYVSHVFRVCLTVRHVFGFDDPRMLAAAVLHDTIEDTTTDYDDLIEHFGPEGQLRLRPRGIWSVVKLHELVGPSMTAAAAIAMRLRRGPCGQCRHQFARVDRVTHRSTRRGMAIMVLLRDLQP